MGTHTFYIQFILLFLRYITVQWVSFRKHYAIYHNIFFSLSGWIIFLILRELLFNPMWINYEKYKGKIFAKCLSRPLLFPLLKKVQRLSLCMKSMSDIEVHAITIWERLRNTDTTRDTHTETHAHIHTE
jgi:hypothetical protein